MADDLQASLKLIRRASSELNQLADDAKTTVANIERFLRDECHIGVSGYVKVAGSDEDMSGQYLEYRRIRNKFRIAVVYADDSGADTHVVPWAEGTQEERLATLPSLGALVQAVARQLRQTLKSARESANSVNDLLASLGQES